MQSGSALGSGLKDPSEVGPHPKEDKEPEKADDSGHGKARGSHGDVDKVDVDDHPRQNRQRQRDIAIDEQQDSRSDLEESNGDVIVGYGKSSCEVGERARGNRRRGQEVKEHIRSKEDKNHAQQVAGDGSGNLHREPPDLKWGSCFHNG